MLFFSVATVWGERVGRPVSGLPIILRLMQKREGRVSRIGRTCRATGLYFFFAAKVASGVSLLDIVQVDCTECSQLQSLDILVLVHWLVSQASK